jgi:hypothetical protein
MSEKKSKNDEKKKPDSWDAKDEDLRENRELETKKKEGSKR